LSRKAAARAADDDDAAVLLEKTVIKAREGEIAVLTAPGAGCAVNGEGG